MTYLLDTSALLAHHRDEDGADRIQSLFEGEEHDMLVASVSLTEFARRLRDLGASPEEALATVRRYVEAIDDVVTVDTDVALSAFDLICRVPDRLPLVDALIASAARSRQACLVHRDRHMSSIPDGMLEQIDLGKPTIP